MFPSHRVKFRTTQCEFCRDVVEVSYQTPSRRRTAALFHDTCESCGRRSSHQDENDLCAFCQHLRLNHLTLCPERDDMPTLFEIRAGRLTDLGSRTDCKLCNFVHSCAHRTAEVSGFEILPTTIATLFIERTRAQFKLWPLRVLVTLLAADGIGNSHQFEVFLNKAGTPSGSVSETQVDKTVTSASIDWQRIQAWLEECTVQHRTCSAQSTRWLQPRGQSVHKTTGFPPRFRLIDVEGMKLVACGSESFVIDPSRKTSAVPRYAALSYVWGKPGQNELMATRATLQALSQKGGLASGLPRTVHDAIEVCRQLQQGYLWCDRLCIVQDDLLDKAEQVEAMDVIYGQADIAIIAATGVDMNAGLPGLTGSRLSLQRIVRFGEICGKLKLPGFSDLIPDGIWASRAWTYQEGVLSRRKLLFTEFQVYFVCEEGRRMEDELMAESETTQLIPSLFAEPKLFVAKEEPRAFSNFSHHLNMYTKRRVTYDDDIYNAFAGVSTALDAGSKTNNSLSNQGVECGLPSDFFDRALLWYPDPTSTNVGSMRRSTHIEIPSWSWASRSCVIYSPVNTYSVPLTRWAIGPQVNRTVNGRLTTDWDCCELPETFAATTNDGLDALRYGAILAWSHGYFEPKCPLTQSQRLESNSMAAWRAIVKRRWKSNEDLWSELWSIPLPISPGVSLRPELSVRSTIICTRTQVAFFRLRNHEPHDFFCFDPFLEILDANNRPIGLLRAYDPLVVSDILPKLRLRHTNFELIALSLHRAHVDNRLQCVLPTRLALEEDLEADMKVARDAGVLSLDENGQTYEEVYLVNVMCVRRRGTLRERVTVGWVFLRKWVEAKPSFETIYLA